MIAARDWLRFTVRVPAVLTATAFVLSWVFPASTNLTAFFLHRQDRWLLLAETGLLLLGGFLPLRRSKTLAAGIWLPLMLAVILPLLCLLGHEQILAAYDMSRDEQMASFDAAVFAKGMLVQPLPGIWRDHADLLNTSFMYSAVHRSAWISEYLPLNAALRALFGLLSSPYLTGGAMTGIGLIALWSCARRIWPSNREAPVVALLLYMGSGQILVSGMTAYAMPAHLAFNLVWLWLFLRRVWWADLLALVVGFVAMGLHQPLMHPLFAGPLLFLLLYEREWLRAAYYAVGYAFVGIFWLLWPGRVWQLVQSDMHASRPAGVDFLTRLFKAVVERDAAGLHDTLANLLRFFAWEHMLLLPLMVLGWGVVRRDRLAQALAGGVLLTAATMAVILPYQGHGFGYRYLHGLIGNCILLAVYGWVSLGKHQPVWRYPLLAGSAVSFFVMVPLQCWMAHGFYAPAAAANARLDALHADYVMIDGGAAPFAEDLVNNDPDLAHRPIRLLAGRVTPQLAALICNHGALAAVADRRVYDALNDYYGLSRDLEAKQHQSALETRLAESGCRIEHAPEPWK